MMYVRVPKERVGALIGKDGETKDAIESGTRCMLLIDSKTGDVTIAEGDDPEGVLKARDIVTAIACGFSPERALILLRNNYFFHSMDIRDYAKRDPKHVARLRGRVIGQEGKTRRIIEQLAEAEVSISGNSVAIIGDILSLDIAREAVEMLLSGSEHATVYRYLERRRRDIKEAEIDMK